MIFAWVSENLQIRYPKRAGPDIIFLPRQVPSIVSEEVRFIAGKMRQAEFLVRLREVGGVESFGVVLASG